MEIKSLLETGIRYQFALGLILRLVLIAYGEWHDATFVVKYTDVDYRVYTDAARFVSEGGSPYQRLTYRYPPLVAWLMLPNVLLMNSFGKVLFSVCDLASGWVLCKIFEEKKQLKRNDALWYSALWVLNPFVINISTRGNADTLICFLVHCIVLQLIKKNTAMAAMLYGLAVHVRIYPIIYVPTILLYLNNNYTGEQSQRYLVFQAMRTKFLFGFASFIVFLILLAFCTYLYGIEFLSHSYFYHLYRADSRHNFSVYFYDIYLHLGGTSIRGYTAFLPSLVAQGSIVAATYKDLSFCMFLQSIAFVAFNKVCTSQYFLWYGALLPLAIPVTSLSLKRLIALLVVWILAQVGWLYWAYQLEFKGQNTFFDIWLASIVFFAVHILLVEEFLVHYNGKDQFFKAE